MRSPDYAKFTIENGKVIPSERIQKKLEAIPFPDFEDKTVLDVGCDYGQFSFLAASRGAKVTGLDRNRNVKGVGLTDLVSLNNQTAKEHGLDCTFHHINIGKQWTEFGRHDIVFVMGVYHHLYENCADHKAVWFWLWRHCGECLIYEGPMDAEDKVVQMNVTNPYSKEEILGAAHIYFESEYIGPALHEPHRHVYKFYPKKGLANEYCIAMQDGAGGASKAFEHDNGLRMAQIEEVVGYKPYAGSLNCLTHKEFNWSYHYYPAEILDVTDRKQGLDSEWSPREARFYPVWVHGHKAHVFRFKGENYPSNFIELIAPEHLRGFMPTEICVCK